MERKFGHCVVQWKIENSYILPTKKVWQIKSPEFQIRASKSTNWIMIFENKEIDGCYNMCFNLQRLCFREGNVSLLGKCDLEVSSEFGKYYVFHDDFSLTEIGSNERKLKVNRNNENTMLSSNLCIVCKIFIRFINVEEETEMCRDLGIFELSQDLLSLFENKRDNDVIFQVTNANTVYAIKAHKHILHCRNAKLGKMLDSDNGISKFVVDHFGHYDEWNNIIRFLYTADMKHVLSPPKEIYYDISLTYQIEPIISFYQPDELVIYSTIPVEEFSYTWTICKFLKRRDICLQTPHIENDSLDTHWSIKLYPKSFYEEDKTCICVEVEGKINKIVQLEIFTVKANQKNCLEIRYGGIADKVTFRGYSFKERKILNHFLQNGNLVLHFKLRMVNLDIASECKMRFGRSVVTCKPYSEENNYFTLSTDISKLYEDKNLHDKFNFLISGEECFIHRCILSARAEYLYEIVQQSKIVKYEKIKESLLSDVIYFLYSGRYNSCELEDCLALYDFSHSFRIISLKHLLLQNLQFNVHNFNSDEIQKISQYIESKEISSFKYSHMH